ncbi:YceI family protein [Bdellovibrio sp. BCCA]|uniref:YceI family protein n=1 Tax=Bdellovibrio sp. BCCA TaxID=3136281 RepID=UPI0030EFD10A
MKFFAALFLTMGLSYTAMAQSVTVDVILNPMGDFKAKTGEVKGAATVKGDEVSAENIVVNLKSLKTGVELRDKHTQKYLDTKAFPEAVLVSATGKGGKGTGKIKIRGVEKDIAGTYKVEGKVLKADFKLNLTDFDIKDINYMGVGVEDEITLHVAVPVK